MTSDAINGPFLRAGTASSGVFSLELTPERAGWRYTSLRVAELKPGASVELDTRETEMLVLPLVGSCRIQCEGFDAKLEGRTSVFDRVSDFAYVPRDTRLVVFSPNGGRFAIAGALAHRRLPARYGPAHDVPVEVRGAGNASRQVNNFAAPGVFDTDRVIAVEVLTPGGNWSSYPPHKHDEERPGEAALEEVYYFEVSGGAPSDRPGPGAYQRVYRSGAGRDIDILAEVATGDVVLVPFGYHGPSMAPPGYDLYYLNVLAGEGPTRTMAFSDDPAHAWVRQSWANQAIDPRVPMTTSEGRRCA
jgi:5-deoxy-glucuronate isomerase